MTLRWRRREARETALHSATIDGRIQVSRRMPLEVTDAPGQAGADIRKTFLGLQPVLPHPGLRRNENDVVSCFDDIGHDITESFELCDRGRRECDKEESAGSIPGNHVAT